jgi:hypothetical protein
MITIVELIQKVYLGEAVEGSEVISHLPHVGETLYTGKSKSGIEHLANALKVLTGKKSEGTISQKVDGKVSILFGKENGRAYVQYKGTGGPKLYSEDEIHKHIAETGKDYLRDSFLAGFQAAQHSGIKRNHTYQADALVHHDEESVKGNIIHYRKPTSSVRATLAVHSKLDTKTHKKLESIPDVDFLNSDTLHVPNLSMNSKTHTPSPEDVTAIHHHIESAKKLMNDKVVSHIANQIAEHRDEKNPEGSIGHRHLHFVSFANKVQAGKYNRSSDDLLNWTKAEMDKSKGLAKTRLENHYNFIEKNKGAIDKLFELHNHVDSARNHVINALNKSNPDLEPIDPDTGHTNYNYSEGFVSHIPGHGTVKFVPTEFTRRNNENKDRFKQQVKEEMSVGGGGVSGIRGPEDVAVPVDAQKRYTRKNKKARQKITEKFLNSNDLMK